MVAVIVSGIMASVKIFAGKTSVPLILKFRIFALVILELVIVVTPKVLRPVTAKLVEVALAIETVVSVEIPGTVNPPLSVVKPVTCNRLENVEEAVEIKPFCRTVRPVMVVTPRVLGPMTEMLVKAALTPVSAEMVVVPVTASPPFNVAMPETCKLDEVESFPLL